MSGLIPQPFIDELLTRCDLVDLIDGYVPLKKRGNSYIACCPFHHEKTPSFNVIAKKQFYHCFGCGVSGNALSFVMAYLNQSFIEAVEMLAARLGLDVPREGNPQKTKEIRSLYQHLTQVAHYYQQNLKQEGQSAIQYLQQRGINGNSAKNYQLGYAPPAWHSLEQVFKKDKKALIATGMLIEKEQGKTYDRFRHRIMFPIHDRHGRLIGFGGRAIDKDQTPKYLNSPETIIFQKNRELYGLYHALQHNPHPEYLLIVEGYMDVIALAQEGVPEAVATLGTATSTWHVQLLHKHTNRLIFCFDGDNAGRKAAWQALESCLSHLNQGLDVRFVFLPEGHDPDSLIRTEGKASFLERLNTAATLTEFFLKHLTDHTELQTIAGKSQLIHTAKPWLSQIPEGTFRQLLLDELSRLTHLETHRIQALLQQAPNTPPPALTTQTAIARTPSKLAIALLLQHPEIYLQCHESVTQDLWEGQQPAILQQLWQRIAKAPDITTAGLIEPWRNDPAFEELTRLAAWDHQVPEEALVSEYLDILHFLQKQSTEKKIDALLEQSRKQGLTLSERLVLQTLLKQRHQVCDVEKKSE